MNPRHPGLLPVFAESKKAPAALRSDNAPNWLIHCSAGTKI